MTILRHAYADRPRITGGFIARHDWRLNWTKGQWMRAPGLGEAASTSSTSKVLVKINLFASVTRRACSDLEPRERHYYWQQVLPKV
jgi:hypothetical protein